MPKDNEDSIRVKRFDGKDFHLWKFQMVIVLEAKGLMKVVGGQEVRPTTDADKQSEWDQKEAKAKRILVTSVEYEQMAHLVNTTTSNGMWVRLLSIYENTNDTSLDLVLGEFYDFKMDLDDSMATNITKIESLGRRLNDMGEKISDKQLVNKILNSLPSSYRHVVSAWDSMDSTKKTIGELTSRLLRKKLWTRSLDKQAVLMVLSLLKERIKEVNGRITKVKGRMTRRKESVSSARSLVIGRETVLRERSTETTNRSIQEMKRLVKPLRSRT